MPTLIFLHGVGGGSPLQDWMTPLDARLHQLSLPRVYQWFDKAIAPTYMPLSTAPLLTRAPQVTFERLSDRSLISARANFIAGRNDLERAIFAAGGSHGGAGMGIVPGNVHGPIAAAAEQFAKFRDVRTWVSSKAARDRARTALLAELPTSGSVVIVAHSLGSVVAAGLLYYLPPAVQVELLVTIGSPLSTRRYAEHVRKIHGDFPFGRLQRWVNLYAPNDGVTGGRGLGPRFAPALDVRTNIGWAHNLQGYMSHPAVATAIGSVMPRPRQSVAASKAPVRRIHPEWRRLLLGAAFAQTISQRLPSDKWEFKIRLDGARREAATREVQEIARQANRRAAMAVEAQDLGITIGSAEMNDHPLAPGRYPSVSDLVDHAEEHLEFSWAFDELLPYAVGLLIQPLARPFDIDADLTARADALEHLIFRVRDRRAALREQADGDLTNQIVKSLQWANKQISGEKRFPTGRVLLASSVVLLGATGVGLAVAAPAGLAGAAVLTATLAGFGPGGMVGGLVTLAALTGSVGALSAAGVALGTDSAQREQAALASADELAHGSTENIEVTLRAMIAVVHAQISLGLECTETHVRTILNEALGIAEREFVTHTEFAKNGPSASSWEAKKELFQKALTVLDTVPGSSEGEELLKARELLDSDSIPGDGSKLQDRLPQLPGGRRRPEAT